MANTAAVAVLGFFFWMIVARYYNEGDVGLGAALLSAITLLASISGMGVDTTMVRFLSTSKKPAELINSALNIELIASLFLSVVYIAGINVWSPRMGFIREQPVFILFFVIFVVGATLTTSVDAILIAKRRAEFVLFKNSLISLLKLALPVVLVNYFHVFGIAGSWGISMSLITAIALLFLIPRIVQHYRPAFQLHAATISRHWRYSAGNYIAALSGQAPALILPIMTLNILGTSQNAYFYTSWMIAALLFSVPGAISQSLFAENSHSPEEMRKNVKRSLWFVFLVLVPLVIGVILFGKWLLLLFGTKYSFNASRLLSILAISSLFVALSSIYYSLLRVWGRIKELVVIYLSVALCVLVASSLLMPRVGIVGIGYAWLGTQVLVDIYILISLLRRIYRDKQRMKTEGTSTLQAKTDATIEGEH